MVRVVTVELRLHPLRLAKAFDDIDGEPADRAGIAFADVFAPMPGGHVLLRTDFAVPMTLAIDAEAPKPVYDGFGGLSSGSQTQESHAGSGTAPRNARARPAAPAQALLWSIRR